MYRKKSIKDHDYWVVNAGPQFWFLLWYGQVTVLCVCVCVCVCVGGGGGGGYIHYLHSLRGTKSVWYLWCLVANPYVEVMLSREEVP